MTSIKSHVLVQFLVECTYDPGEAAPEMVNFIEDSQEKVWLLYLDGARNPRGLGAGILLWSPEGNKIEYAPRFAFTPSKNEAEYEALANGLILAKDMGEEQIHIQMDSQLLVGHMKGDLKINEMKERFGILLEATVVEWVEEEAFQTKEVMNNVGSEGEEGPPVRWYQDVLEFLTNRILPGDPPVANKIKRQSLSCTLLIGFYTKDYSRVYCSVDYLTKWAVAKHLTGQDQEQVLVTDNVTQFTSGKIEDLYVEMDIDKETASVSYPQANGQMEVMNQVIFKGVNKRLE
ncbi:hypothetical protein LIER_16222 [Lithospermum erythrorhizon]|uniref:Integrase catalytic domain-containing protein n=1 Tax=Lithospermum erythrorhizon TaxID=34254 RepID=A0AAV3Q8E7_LITER